MAEPTFPSVSGYCQIIDVWRRMGPNGFLWAVDRKGAGSATADQVQSFAASAIAWASGIIDVYLDAKIRPEVAEGMGNDWLRDRCIDIAVYRVMTIGGREVVDTVHDDYTGAIEMLRLVKDQYLEVPRLTIPPAIGAPRGGSNRPRIANMR
ncbi:MAG: DUF1320 family protein [Patescibacteria group bacterium]|nr:DUF1320 family protein [Patescibacteria group bacterium]